MVGIDVVSDYTLWMAHKDWTGGQSFFSGRTGLLLFNGDAAMIPVGFFRVVDRHSTEYYGRQADGLALIEDERIDGRDTVWRPWNE